MAITRKKPLQCPIEATLAAISARWKARIVWQLAVSPQAFITLRDGVTGISDRMLTEQLSQMVEDRLVALERDGAGQRYRLTPLGLSLLPVLQVMHGFGQALIEQRDSTTVAIADKDGTGRLTALRARQGPGEARAPSARESPSPRSAPQRTGNFAPAAR